MSKWFDLSNSANKLRQSYLKGFLDVSGGGIYIRSDNSINFYTSAGSGGDEAKPKFSADATKLRIWRDGSSQYFNVDNEKLIYLLIYNF